MKRRSKLGGGGRALAALGTLGLLLPAVLATPSRAHSAHGRPLAVDRAQDPDEAELDELAELAELSGEERREADRLRRRGAVESAERRLDDLLEEAPADAEARTILALCLHDRGQYARALEEAQRALADALASGGGEASAGEPAGTDPAARGVRAAAARAVALVLGTLGRSREALAALDAVESFLAPSVDARDAWAIGRASWESGDRTRARRLLALGAATDDDQAWDGLLARGLCQRRLGEIEAASQSLVRADQVAKAGVGVEPDVLSALGDLYFEADREVEAAKRRSAAQLYKEALGLNASHEGAALGLFRLHRYNWLRRSQSAHDILARFLSARPNSIEGAVAGAQADLDDGQLKSARERLARLDLVAPGRRDVRTLHAALAWIEHKRDECASILAALAEEDPEDATPEREVGRHLLELYRFAEALPFERRAVERDPEDWEAWTQLGRALANTGDEDGARDAFDRAQETAGLRQDAWRDNMRLVLKNMAVEMKREKQGELVFAWSADAADVLRAYLVPFYTRARRELAERYGFTPEPTTIEVFRRHKDFSVRSTGFEGFPALGVCFGPVVTAVSPISELRQSFSWARTSFHEFTHVIHLGLSHNRCPRWITEGLATWEEVNENPDWTRNMRRDLVDAERNGMIIPVRELNRAFRGPRILFGYYQGGLLCEMLIGQHGFPPMIRLLEAFDRGLDLDQAFVEVFETTPEQVDRDFAAFVAKITAPLAIEARWEPARIATLRGALGRKAPSGAAARARWADDWCTVAWGMWQQGKKVDAQEALRVLQDENPQPARASLLRGEIAFAGGDTVRASEIWKQTLAGGVEDYRVRMALGSLAAQAGDFLTAEQHFVLAERAFPGFDDPEVSAELKLVQVYEKLGRKDDSRRALERWLGWNSGDLKGRRTIALWHVENGRHEASLEHFEEANEVDPFLRGLHREWGDALRATGRHAEALREYEVGLLVPPDLDADQPGPIESEERAEWLALQAAMHSALGRGAEAIELANQALEHDPDSELARETLQKQQ